MTKLHRSEFLKELKRSFPEIRKAVNEEYGLLVLELMQFRIFTQNAIDDGDKDTVIECFRIADKYIREGNSRMINAFAVSYLEHLNFENEKVQRSWAKELLPPAAREHYESVMEYWRELSERWALPEKTAKRKPRKRERMGGAGRASSYDPARRRR